jgi:hypothetical protein
MCWNQDVSLNTFLFACLVLLFIFITNTYTKYKTPTFDNPLVYLFLFLVAAMQLIEFFLWRNLKNKKMNEQLTKIASFDVFMQQITLIMLIPNLTIRFGMAISYLSFVLFYVVYKGTYDPINYYTTVGENGHLSWGWTNYTGYETIWAVICLFFYISAALLINNFILTLFLLTTLAISSFFYYKYNTLASMWCWLLSTFLLYFVVDILLIQPFREYNGIC